MIVEHVIIVAQLAIMLGQAVAYRRLWRQHLTTIGALWAADLGK